MAANGRNVTTQITRPNQLTPTELDAYLARGWFRIGPTLTTCRYLTLAGDLRSAIWLRYDLETWAPHASHRRRMRKVRERFEVRFGPAIVDEAREALYQRYLEVAPGMRPQTLRAFLFHKEDRDLDDDAVWDTRELTVWDGDRLVALHWCDLGQRAVASLLGAYDPAYHRYSLGFVTLLLEMDWARQLGLRYHYPGYVVPGAGSMDYKLRIREVEAFDPETGVLRDWSEVSVADEPLLRLDRALDRIASRLAGPVRRITHPSFALLVEMPNAAAFVDLPRFLAVAQRDDDVHLLVLFDPREQHFVVQWARRVEHPAVRLDGTETMVTLWVRGPVVVSSPLDDVIVLSIRRMRSQLGGGEEQWG